MTVEWADDPRAFVTWDWSDLAAADPEGTLFHTPRYLKLYWEEFGGSGLRIARVLQGGRPIAAAVLEVRDGVAAWLGGSEVTDYMGPVGVPETRTEAAKELMGALAARREWSRAELGGLLADGAWLRALARAARDAGLEAGIVDEDVAPVVALASSFEEYLAALPGKLRHELRRRDRRLREALSDATVVDASPSTLQADLDRFVDLHRTSAGEKGRFMVPGMELFFRRLGEALVADGTFRLAFLQAGGQRIAGAVGFRDRRRFLLYNSAYDHGQARFSPGMVLTADLIRSSIDEGCSWFDLLKGDHPYKYRFGARRRRVARLVLLRP